MDRLLLLVLWFPLALGPDPQRSVTAPQPGERCGLCGAQLQPDERVIVHRGRRLGICSLCEERFESDPDRYLARLGPRAALWQESDDEREPPHLAWTWFGGYVLIGLIFGALCGFIAVDRGHPAARWFVLGLVGNVFALAAALWRLERHEPAPLAPAVPPGLRKAPRTLDPVRCGGCGQENHPAATACSGCGTTLEPRVPSEVQRAHETRPS